MNQESGQEPASTPPQPPPQVRWVVYFSRDRRVLWTEMEGPHVPMADGTTGFRTRVRGDSCPVELTLWTELHDLAVETRLPQYGMRTLHLHGGDTLYTLKMFPDLTLDGELKGLIQVMEPTTPDVDWGADIKRSVNALLDLTLNGVILYSPSDDRILNINRRVAQQTGYPMAELQDMPGTTLFGAAGAAMLKSIFARMTTAGSSMVWGQDLVIRDSYGDEKNYLCSLRAIPERPGPDSPLAMIISLDTATPTSGGMPSGPNPGFLVKAMQDSLWEYDIENNLFHYSRTFLDLFGPDGLEGYPGKPMDDWLQAVHPDDATEAFHKWRRLLKRGERYNIQYRLRDGKGNWRWILSIIHAILNDSHGRPKRVIGFHMDITESVRTNMDVVDAEERLRMIFDNAGIGIAVADVDRKLARVNPALALMLGRDPEDLEGGLLSDFSHEEDREAILGILSRLMRGGRREAALEQRFVRSGGGTLWANLTATLSARGTEGNRYVIVMMEDVTERHGRQEQLQYEATHDIMTGAWNRWILMERLEQHVSLAKRHHQSMAFCICDLDHFKGINDAHGHQAGDQVLVRFVEILNAQVRDTEVVGRYGGEEFGIIFPNTGAVGAGASMERARSQLMTETFLDSSGSAFRITCSFGVAGATPRSTAKNMISEADAALYEAKEGGRNRVVVRKPAAPEYWL